MDFPHLQDTNFPHLNTENVYAFKNTFDYTRWNENSVIRLVNVLWDGDGRDVPVFESNDARDLWFDSIADGYTTRLETAARIIPENFVKLPLPYDVAARYNYLYVEVPIAANTESLIDYEVQSGVRRWYYFIDRIEYGAPNATKFMLSCDFWTTFHNDIDIRYMYLDRGHAPVAATDVETYLNNPIENNQLLLAPDVNFGSTSIVRNSSMIPFGSGKKYVVFASMATRENVIQMGSRSSSSSGSWTNPTYSNASGRDGHQLNVSGYVWGDGYDYSSLRTRIDNNASNLDRLANNATCWCIEADKCFGFRDSTYYDSFLVKLGRECPAFLQTILAMFVVDESMLSFNYRPVTICGYKLYYCRGTVQKVKNLDIKSYYFNYPSKYSRFAKLYTFPYASLELTDNDNQTVSIKIEDTGKIKYQLITSLAFPFLDMRVLFNGIGGSGQNTYTWTNLVDAEQTINIGADDWGEIKFDWPIPTFGLYLDGENAYNLHNYGDLQSARIDALTNYHTSMRQANCAYNNAVALADTAKTNADATADTLVANNANTCNAQTANTAITCATNTANNTLSVAAATNMNYHSNDAATRTTTNNNTLMVATTQAENESSIATTSNNNNAAIATGGINGVMSSVGTAGAIGAAGGASIAAGVGLMAVSGLVGSYSASINAEAASANAVILTQVKSSVASNTSSTNSANTAISTSTATNNTNEMNDCKTNQNTNSNNCITQQTANNVAAATNNTANNSNNMKSNASRTQSTSNSNSSATHTIAEANAKEILEAAQDKARNRYYAARNAAPIHVGSVSGDPSPEYFMTRGIQVKVRTQSDSAISQAGDYFARYGYALNQMWDVKESGWCPMNHFCYWKVSEIWIDDRLSSTGDAGRAIKSLLENGVTMWKNPDEIGRVSVYDN